MSQIKLYPSELKQAFREHMDMDTESLNQWLRTQEDKYERQFSRMAIHGDPRGAYNLIISNVIADMESALNEPPIDASED